MIKEEFINKVVDKGWLWSEQDGKLYIKLKNGKVIETQDEYSQDLLKHIGSYDVVGMTRIVGYYSRVTNWNPSKLGELKDRQAGQKQGRYGI